MRWKKTIILNRYLSDCPYIRLVLFNEKDIYIVLNGKRQILRLPLNLTPLL